MASIGELFINLGVKGDTKKLDEFKASVTKLRSNLIAVGAAFTGAVVGLNTLVNSSLKGVVNLQNLSNQTGLAVENLQKLQQAGQLSNLALSADQIAQSMGNLQKSINDITVFGEGDITPFSQLGVDPMQSKTAFEVLERVRENIKGLNAATATNLISKIGLSPEFINILRLSREEFDKLSNNIFLSGKQRKDIDNLGTSIKGLQLRFIALKDQAVAKLAPELDKLVNQFFKWVDDNGDNIIQLISGIGKSFAVFTKAVSGAFSLVSGFINKISGLENGITILTAAMAGLLLTFRPFLLGLGAIVLLLEDFAVFSAGGESLIGDLVNAFKDIPDIVKLLGGGLAVGTIVSNFGKIAGAMKLMLAPALALATQLGLIVSAITFLAKAPEIGEKLADKFSETGIGKLSTDVISGFQRGGFVGAVGGIIENRAPVSINNTNNYNIQGTGAQDIGTAIESGQSLRDQSTINFINSNIESSVRP
jgi:hypothetical protein